jgi:hypothetical protein
MGVRSYSVASPVCAVRVVNTIPTPYGQKIGTAEEPGLDRSIELAGAQSWGADWLARTAEVPQEADGIIAPPNSSGVCQLGMR